MKCDAAPPECEAGEDDHCDEEDQGGEGPQHHRHQGVLLLPLLLRLVVLVVVVEICCWCLFSSVTYCLCVPNSGLNSIVVPLSWSFVSQPTRPFVALMWAAKALGPLISATFGYCMGIEQCGIMEPMLSVA